MPDEIVRAESEFESLKKRILQLRAAIGMLLAERDELRLRECPAIEAEYNARIGDLELRVYRARAKVLELKRAIEILQASANRQEETSPEEARARAKEEYRQFEEKLREAAEKVKKSREYREREERKNAEWEAENPDAGQKEEAPQGEARDEEPETDGSGQERGEPGPEEAGGNAGERKTRRFRSREDELKHYYRKLMKLLHPDARPDQSAGEAQLLQEVMDAYAQGDLERLRELFERVNQGPEEEEFRNSPDGIRQMKETLAALEAKYAALEAEIRGIRNSFPYTAKEFLADEEAVSARQKELADLLAEYDEQYRKLLLRYERLKEGKDPDGDE